MSTTGVPLTSGADESAARLPSLMNVEETARFLRIGRTAAYEAIRTGMIPHIRVGKLIRVPSSGLLAWIERTAAQQADGDRQEDAAGGQGAAAVRLTKAVNGGRRQDDR